MPQELTFVSTIAPFSPYCFVAEARAKRGVVTESHVLGRRRGVRSDSTSLCKTLPSIFFHKMVTRCTVSV
jgi:hypothetical protein